MSKIYRVLDRVHTEVIPTIKKVLNKNIPIYYNKVYMGDKHIIDRVVDRGFSIDIPLKNITYLFTDVIEKHICEILYHLHYSNKQVRINSVYKKSKEEGILLGISIEKKVDSSNRDCLIWKLVTYIPEWDIRNKKDFITFFVHNK